MKAIGLFIFCMIASLSVWSKDHEMKECHQQLKEICKDKRGAAKFACIKDNKAQLSPECQKKIEEKKAKWKDHSEACKADREKFCSSTKAGAGRIIQCMKNHMEQLSAECKAQMQKENTEPTPPAE